MSPSNPIAERAAAATSLSAAIRRRDYQGAFAIESDWARRYPADLDFRRFEPALHLMAGDRAGWQAARTDLLQRWAQLRGKVPPPPDPSFTLDVIRVGSDTVVADQCLERAGRFGVLYRFSVVSPDGAVHSFFTVESADADNQVARELGQKQRVFSIDHFRPGLHETVAILQGSPDYDDLRRRVLGFIADPKPLSASGNGQGGLSSERCSVNPP